LKASLLLSLLLFTFPVWITNPDKDKLIVFASLSYYKCDFDGDGLGDFSVWHSPTNTLYYQLTSDRQSYEKKFFDTKVTYLPVFADYNGDKKTDFAFFQPDSAQWVLFLSPLHNNPVKTFFGSAGDIPVPVDLNGDGANAISVWRPNASAWVIGETLTKDEKPPKVVQEGNYQDSVFAADYDGDKKADLIVWRPDDGYWHIVKSSSDYDFNKSEHIQHGKEWDIIVPNDYNQDGKCDLVFWRPDTQTWHFLYSGTSGQNQIKFGEKNDIPMSNDLDGDGLPELITWNIEKKSWNILNLKKQESFSYKWVVPDGSLPAVSVLQKYE